MMYIPQVWAESCGTALIQDWKQIKLQHNIVKGMWSTPIMVFSITYYLELLNAITFLYKIHIKKVLSKLLNMNDST